MARRESQGLQIALILFVMITVILSVSTWYYWSENDKNIQVAESDRNALEAFKAKVKNEYEPQNARLNEMIGWEDSDDIETQFSKDMLYLSDVPLANRNYKTLTKHFLDALIAPHQQYLASINRLRQEEQNVQTARTDESAIANTERAAKETAVTDLASERRQFNEARNLMVANNETLASDLLESQNEITAVSERSQRELQALSDSLAQSESRLQVVRDKLKDLEGAGEIFENPDGGITWVNQGSGVVWLNLGSVDGLHRQVSFSVYDVDENNLVQSDSKGKIEVTRIMGDHIAEARITNDSLEDPILPGDLVYSPVWQPGQMLRFAIAGFIDIDDNGESDQDLVRRLITMNGGVLDAEINEEGERIGTLSIHTRYLIVGDRLTERTDPEALREYTLIMDHAQQLGIEHISVEKFVELVGYQAEDRSIPIGRNTDPDDFRPRRPPGRGSNGAYN